MKKCTSRNKKPIKQSQTISSYFTKVDKPTQKTEANHSTKTTDKSLEVICVTDSDDDFVTDSKRLKVNGSATNLPECSKTYSVPKTPENKKRKHSHENTSPVIIPCSLNPNEQAKIDNIFNLILRKKTKQATHVSDDSHSSITEPKLLSSPTKNTSGLQCKPLEELIDQKLNSSPNKNFLATFSLKNGEPNTKSPSKTPNKKRSPPLKLFNKSPKVNQFNIEVIENFVRVTPGKSNSNNSTRQLQLSPVASARSSGIQEQNENTPPRPCSSSTPCSITPRARVKIKLDFSINDHHKEGGEFNENNCDILKETEESLCMLNDSWDEQLDSMENITSDLGLDLTESQHCKVVQVHRTFTAMKLLVKSTKSGLTALCCVEGFWLQLQINVDDTLHITAVYDKSASTWCIDNDRGLIVFEPDFLVSITSVVGAVFCRRRSVLSERYRSLEPSNRIMIIGILVHKLLQETLKRNAILDSDIEEIIKEMLLDKDTMWMCYQSSLTITELHGELAKFVPRLVVFMKQYVMRNKKVQSVNKENWEGRIDSIRDIEEIIWCPELGVKGKVDVSIQSGSAMMPLELKTGRATVSLEHRGQVMFYVMMMNKFGYTVPSGLLLYLREGVLKEIKTSNQEKRDLMILRNELTYYLTRKPRIIDKEALLHPELPEPINHRNACTNCPYNTICCAYLKHEKTDLTNNPLKQLQTDVLAHLKSEHLEYFIKWSSLLALEASCMLGNKQLHEIYTVPPEQREKNGQCISGMKIKETVTKSGDLFKHTFEKIIKEGDVINLSSFGINMGNYVVVSVDNRPAVAAGFVTDLDYQAITIMLDRDLNHHYTSKVFHLDTYNSSISESFNMTNLSLLLEASEQAEKLRSIVIDKKLPSFRNKLPKAVATKGTPILRTLNKMQQKAVLKALSSDDYLLIKGMPGTGKTATIVALIKLLVQIRKTVLITSHTHSAVDNICVRLLDSNISVLRLGNDSKIQPKLRSCSENARTQHCSTPEELEEVYNGANVLAVTCLGSGHPVLSKRRLDVCIVDESTQVLQCSMFRALYSANKFILVGDPDQLPPVIRNQEAVARGLSESLFERLDTPKATVTLTFNYRMNKPITAMANMLTYHNELVIANDSVADATLRLPNEEGFLVTYNSHPWVLEVLDGSLSSAVKILDTGPVLQSTTNRLADEINNASRNDGGERLKCINAYEVAVIVFLVDALLMAGVPGDAIGIIAPYRAQVAQLSSALNKRNVEVSTVDRFQGRDKDVILYSCTKSCDPWQFVKVENDILEDKRRLTVAITRAKHKFILIGDLSTIKRYAPFSKLLDNLENNCFVKLENDHLGFHWDIVMRDFR